MSNPSHFENMASLTSPLANPLAAVLAAFTPAQILAAIAQLGPSAQAGPVMQGGMANQASPAMLVNPTLQPGQDLQAQFVTAGNMSTENGKRTGKKARRTNVPKVLVSTGPNRNLNAHKRPLNSFIAYRSEPVCNIVLLAR